MSKINWCIEQKDGIRLIEPNTNLSIAYLKKAEDSLFSLKINKIKDWKIAISYYTIYFSIYSILMKIGVKCEIHSCTLEFCNEFLKDYFSLEEIEFFKNSLKARVDAQYYINRAVADKQVEEMIIRTPLIYLKCKNITQSLTQKDIENIRIKIKVIIK